MKRCSSRPLAAGASVFLTIGIAFAPDAAGQALGPCKGGLLCEQIPSEELVGVFDDQGGAVTGRRLTTPNLAVAAVLSRLDIDGDEVPDNSPDSDGDGLPDNWEANGIEALTAGGETLDRVVFFPAPTPIVPGTPPTPIFSRLQVATSALDPDTDDDGLSDFIEVFGLMFINEDGDGLLDYVNDGDDETALSREEWNDSNNDGLPSPGEWPLDNSLFDPNPFRLLHDFDGFVFTDPTNSDTDGDSLLDGEDNDPLINPRAFGNTESIIVRFNAEGNADIDKDGLGNGMDMGNDLTPEEASGLPGYQVIDNPENVVQLLELFRRDLLEQDIVPESAIEDLFGVDWDGNGLWRTTDVRNWSLVIGPDTIPPDELFIIDSDGRIDENDPRLYALRSYAAIEGEWTAPDYDDYGGRGIGLGWQDLLRPAAGATPFVPDPRVWAVLYAWRMPGFDIDGDGFIGSPTISATASTTDADECPVYLNRSGEDAASFDISNDCADDPATDQPFDDRIAFVRAASDDGGIDDEPDPNDLDGRIVAPEGFLSFGCARGAGGAALITFLAMASLRFTRRR